MHHQLAARTFPGASLLPSGTHVAVESPQAQTPSAPATLSFSSTTKPLRWFWISVPIWEMIFLVRGRVVLPVAQTRRP